MMAGFSVCENSADLVEHFDVGREDDTFCGVSRSLQHLQNRLRGSICLFDPLLGCVQHVSAGNLALVHKVVDHLELRQADDLKGRLDEAAAVEVESFRSVLAVADVGSLDGDHLHSIVSNVLGVAMPVGEGGLTLMTLSNTGALR